MIQTHPAQRTVLMLKTTPGVNKSGDNGVEKLTLQQLFEREESPLLRYAFALTGRRAVAEEIVQEAFLQLHARWDEVESPKAWLFRSVRNRAYNHVRDNKREQLVGEGEEPENIDAGSESAEELLNRIEATGALRQLLETLSEPDRQLVKLKYFEGLKYREIADQTGLSISNVGYRLHHILKELADQLRPLGFDTIS